MKSFRNFFWGLCAIMLLSMPVFLHAQDFPPTPPPPRVVPGITNPIKYNDLSALLFAVAEEAAKIGFYVVALFIIWSGFLFVSAQGDKTRLETAKKTFFYTVIGATILLGAMVFARVIEGTVNQLRAADTAAITDCIA